MEAQETDEKPIETSLNIISFFIVPTFRGLVLLSYSSVEVLNETFLGGTFKHG